MSEYIVSARKYRPIRFSEMVGQEQVATTLKNAIKTNHLAHSFLFCGPRGVGKTTAARILAKTINCENIQSDFEACGKCESCVSFAQNASFNIHELDAASNNSVEDMRSLVDQVRFPPQSGKYKIYIIDEVHMLSPSAFNAFLKTLEEPPSYCKFILATTEKHKILPTILSRCQIFDFKRIGVDTIVAHLKNICQAEKIEAEEDALHIIAQKADGGMRDALSMFDRLSSFAGGKLTYAAILDNLNVLDYDYFFKVTDALLIENLTLTLILFDEILKKGFEGDDFILGLCEHFRNILFCKDADTLKIMEVSENLKQRYALQSSLASPDFLVNCLSLGNQSDVQYKTSKNKRLTVELTLIKMCYVNSVVNDTDDGKKKLKQDSKETPILKHNPTEKVIPVPEEKLVMVEEPKEIASNPPVHTPNPKPSAAITKTKKVLTLDSLKDLEDAAAATTLTNQDVSENYADEILILNEENVLKLWDDYAARIPEEKKGLRISFANFKPLVDSALPNRLHLKVKSEIQKSQFDDLRLGIQSFISSRLGVEIDLVIEADKELITNAKPYTPKEKFERMAEKNPNVKKMVQLFGLELDYNN
ncbi:MAG: DNA polymerase III subunit gamma/tau [Bacteroidetes bacterium]|nr:DNA polymerase III subunit gamma/tau [Bacteroidota bacterium]